MPQVIITEGAAQGLEWCRKYLVAKAPEAARRVGQAIQQQFILLEMSPNMGRPIPDEAELRELGYRLWEFQLRSTL